VRIVAFLRRIAAFMPPFGRHKSSNNRFDMYQMISRSHAESHLPTKIQPYAENVTKLSE